MSVVTVVLGAGNGNGNGNGNSFAISGNTPGFVAKANDLGPADPNTVIAVTVWLKLHNEAQLDKLVAQQHQRGSGQYHNWITQDQFNVISNSWGSFEALGNPAHFIRDNRILEMAAAQGIDVNFSTGDFGDNSPVLGFATVQFPASSPFATGIGGTSLALNPDNTIAFQTGWGTNLTRIADTVSLGSPPVVLPLKVLGTGFNPGFFLGFQFGAGGGASGVFPRPSFQSSLSVPGNTRLLPDISWLADPFTGVEIIITDPASGQLSVTVVGGTSLACPMFSALMAVATEKAGHGLGQAAQLVYSLPMGAITDVIAVTSPNDVTGVIDGSPISTRWFVITFGTDTSLTTGPGWDNVTGVGTPNGLSFINGITQ